MKTTEEAMREFVDAWMNLRDVVWRELAADWKTFAVVYAVLGALVVWAVRAL